MFTIIMETISTWAIPLVVALVCFWAILKKVPVYSVFTEGAKEGFSTAVMIIPYLTAMLCAIGMFRASGAMETITNLFAPVLNKFSIPTDSLPIMLTRSLSGSATLGLFSEIAHKFGPDAYVTKLCAIMVGSSETTFYVLSVYFGSIGITKFRYALLCGIIADIIGIIGAIFVCSLIYLPNFG